MQTNPVMMRKGMSRIQIQCLIVKRYTLWYNKTRFPKKFILNFRFLSTTQFYEFHHQFNIKTEMDVSYFFLGCFSRTKQEK